MNRRQLLQGIALPMLINPPRSALAHGNAGPVEPALPLPDWRLETHKGQGVNAHRLLSGQFTAIQLMFTGCSALCPLQGALFAAVQAALPAQLGAKAGRVRLLSISIDPLADTPQALQKWLQQFEAGPAWTAVRPTVSDLTPLLTTFNGTLPLTSADRHSTQTFLVDDQGRLRWRSVALPSAASVLQALQALM
jgi:protein SCO1/2